ncbi:Carbonic anhydrase 1 [Streptomyces sp. ADI96-02]|uniref:carbonic anhydrase n=1 Tax=Streptomyces sp. ADI96-02 TaxID=1522760 RepID=UPI000F54F391|nr:carbonic anhydrase [Streptomyces sp. ADI96-02]RPK69234.1 Carbonic anhydrase 1 [Streptomyces sp. ADI96-02]
MERAESPLRQLIDRARVYPALAAAHKVALDDLVAGPMPGAMVISCSDARVVPAFVMAGCPGDLFELRTYGGRVPPYQAGATTGEARTIEYAVNELKVSDIIVYGHSHCEAVVPVHDRRTTEVTDASDATTATGELTAAGHWHVLRQLDALGGYPCVVPLLAAGSLRLHAWFHEMETGTTLAHRPRANAFLPL